MLVNKLANVISDVEMFCVEVNVLCRSKCHDALSGSKRCCREGVILCNNEFHNNLILEHKIVFKILNYVNLDYKQYTHSTLMFRSIKNEPLRMVHPHLT